MEYRARTWGWVAWVVPLCLGIAACGGSEEPVASGNTGGAGSSGSGGTSGTAGSSASGELTLDNCQTNIAADVPAFYKTYFRCVTITMENNEVVIVSKGLPPYKTYYYGKNSPNFTEFDTSRGTQYKPNPNVIKESKTTIRIPMAPKMKTTLPAITTALVDGEQGPPNQTFDYKPGPVGIALNSVLMFNPLARPPDKIEDEQFTFDDYNAHPQMDGQYHYHAITKGPLQVLVKNGITTQSEPGKAELELYGILCDGTLVMGCTELDQSSPTTTDFDAQNGHLHDIKGKDGTLHFSQRYHVHICPTWPMKTRQFTPEIQYYDTCSASQ
jgi:hypothetical protein